MEREIPYIAVCCLLLSSTVVCVCTVRTIVLVLLYFVLFVVRVVIDDLLACFAYHDIMICMDRLRLVYY